MTARLPSERPDPTGAHPGLLGLMAGGSALLLAWTWPLWGGGVELLCPWKALSGIPCPTCGATRAVLAAMAGNWAGALALNPLAAVGAMATMLYVPWTAAAAAGGWWHPDEAWLTAHLRSRPLRWVAAAAVLGNWLYLIAHLPR